MQRMRIRLKTDDSVISISPDYKKEDIPMIVKQLVKYDTSWPRVQMSFGEFFRRAREQGVSTSEAIHCLADEIVPFTIDWDAKKKPGFQELCDEVLAYCEAKGD